MQRWLLKQKMLEHPAAALHLPFPRIAQAIQEIAVEPTVPPAATPTAHLCGQRAMFRSFSPKLNQLPLASDIIDYEKYK
jgi:hypothetical protein